MAEPGQQLAGRYQVESILGQGGMGAVYLAQQPALGKKVAIKEMELRGFNKRELAAAVKQFQSEATFLANLEHPNLVPVTDFFVEDDKHYLVMAYIDGQTLQQKLRANGAPFSWTQVLAWARPLCGVLSYLHGQNPPILFRDLKPSNVMIEEDGRLRLIDFGIARIGQEGERTSTFLQGTGTSGFSPLEQYGGGQSTDQRSDIYALAATLYQLLTGTVPPDAVSRASQGVELVGPSQKVPELPRALDAVLLKAMAQKKTDRHATVADFAAALDRVEAAAGEDAPTEDLGPVPPGTLGSAPATRPITVEMVPRQPESTPTAALLGIGAVAALSLLVGAYWINRDPVVSEAVAPPAAAISSQSASDDDTSISGSASGSRLEGAGVGAPSLRPEGPSSAQRLRTSPGTRASGSGAPPKKTPTVAASSAVSVSAPAAATAPRTITGSASSPETPYPTARPGRAASQSAPVPAASEAAVSVSAPAPQPPTVTEVSQPATIQSPVTGYQPRRPGDPPAIPDGRGDELLYDSQGRPLPPHQQPSLKGGPRGPRDGYPGELSTSQSVPGYDTARRR